MIFRTQYNYQGHKGESSTNPSLTIPGESYTIRELLDKFAQGILPPVGRSVQYDEDPDIDNIDPTKDPAFDLADLTELKNQTEETLQELEKKQNQKAEADKKETALQEAKKLLEIESAAKDHEQEKNLPEQDQ